MYKNVNYICSLAVSCAIVTSLCACGSSKNAAQSDIIVATASPQAVVYRTNKDYSRNVPVILDENKENIVSFPDPVDVRNFPVPTPLDKGYLLDNRGIGPHVAYTDYTFAEYAMLDKVPSIEELQAHIIDRNPIAEMWLCGPRHSFSDIRAELNLIIKKRFKGCQPVIGKNK